MDDLLVVGAGPAGNNAAYRLASMGHSVTVVDWRTQIGDKLCTGIVGHECTERFPIDKSLIFQDTSVARVVAPGGEAVDFQRKDVQAHVVDRVAYVADLARRSGATYLLGYRVTDVACDGNGASIQITDDNEQRTLRGRALVLASGFGSELTGQLGLGKASDYATGIQAEVLAPEVTQIHVYFGQDVAPGVFAWLVPTSGGKAQLGLLSRHRAQTHLRNLLLKLQVDGVVTEVTKAPARWGVPLRPIARTFGERMLAVGDVAGQVKPTTGGGIYHALLASEIASETLHESLKADDLSASRLSEYEKDWKSVLSQEMEIGYSARRLFEGMKDNQVDFVMHAIARNGIYKEIVESRLLSFDWHSGIITRMMGQPVLRKALGLFHPLLATLAPQS